ncbi:MAG: toll/interleukin-1 receptor domain-containing protein, partial [Actinomycetota bacterium]
MNPRIFISYRREDSAGHAGRLYDRLASHFGHDNVFMDVDTLDPGVDFVDVVDRSVRACDALVAVMGRHWLGTGPDAGGRRIDDPTD